MSTAQLYPAIAASASRGWQPASAVSATLIADYMARDDLVTLVSGEVASVANRIAGGANPLIQPLSGSSQRPIYEPTGWDGVRGSILLNGTTNFLHAHGLTASVSGSHVALTVVMSMQILTVGVVSGNNRAFWCFGNSSSDTPLCAATILDGSASGAISRRDDASTLKQPAMATSLTTARATYTHRFNGSKGSVRVNGTLDANLDGTSSGAVLDLNDTTTTLNTFSVGCAVRTTAAWRTHMRLGRMLVYVGALSDAEAALAEKCVNTSHPR